MHKKRPVHLDLTKIHFPIMAIVSILHRISGVLIFLSLPVLLLLWQYSLLSEQSFADVHSWMSNGYAKGLMLAILSGLGFHLFAGIRHLLMDLGFFETVPASRLTAIAVFVLVGMFVLGVGVWIW